MIKVPASREGLPAIRQLTSEGLNVNITLLFGIERYEQVARAYIDGVSMFVQNGGDPAQVSSVASFFVSRIDTMIDGLITARLAAATDADARTALTRLLGNVAIANARLAYQRYLALCRTTEWDRLAALGAHPQRLLWASTSTKNPRYRDVRYVEELIGLGTVNTITPATLDAFRDHGRLRSSLEEHVDDARATIEALGLAGIYLTDATDRLLEDGVTQFIAAFDRLLAVVDRGRRSAITTRGVRDAFHNEPHPFSLKA
jgi:transaldolase/glucose-6-phosphate isomerase